MSNETYLTVIGRLTQDPELRYLPSGAAVANFTVASEARFLDKQTNDWKKKPTTFWRCAAWNQGERLKLADNVVDALKKGDSVIVRGEIESREYQTKEGENRSVIELRIETIGKDLRWHQPAANNVAAQSQGGFGGQSSGGGFGGNQPAVQEDPWATPTANAGGWSDSTPPF